MKYCAIACFSAALMFGSTAFGQDAPRPGWVYALENGAYILGMR